MAFARFDKTSGTPMSEINMVPLIDVMLVLLIIFMVTAPLLTHSVNIDLPDAEAQPTEILPETIDFAIDAQGNFYWNGEKIDRNTVHERFVHAGKQPHTPAVHLRIDEHTPYRDVAAILAEASRAGIDKIGFLTIP